MGRLVDLTNKTFGRLTVLHKAESVSGRTMWLCRCECGILRLLRRIVLKLEKLKAENAALRERLEKIIEPPCKIGDILYTVTTVFSDVWVGDTILHRNGFSISETEVTEKNIWNMCDLIRRGMAFFSKEAAEARLKELQGEEK